MYKKFGVLGSGCDGRARRGIMYVGSDEREAGTLGESAWPFFFVSEREKKKLVLPLIQSADTFSLGRCWV